MLRAQLALDLCKGSVQVEILVGKESTTAGPLRHVTKYISIYSITFVTDTDRVNDCLGSERTIDCFLKSQTARRVQTVRQKNDRSTSQARGLLHHIAGRQRYRVPDRSSPLFRRSGQTGTSRYAC